jgi:hypothetical protein
MTEGFEGLTPATSDPDMKVVLESDADEPQALMEWTTPHWAGQPNQTYHIDGTDYRAKDVREDREADGTVVYRVTVVPADETS